ncbi:Phosphatidylinositol 4-phosphate 5-kinase type-1 beta [Pleurostoma richardsiae]|uniref:Phosphatidylinositol 4-phosphate 5-kinase type-1 beta n=1 Tax=Pleurostoma richardsiae TaxID=41990 RepID=A0AA38S1V2_9PEZI|nr:Phosphatidylinositol 4-phosphate 5-kinase type-1 beta [Pleurostoma richardsiae]
MARDKSIARSVVRAITANEGAKIRSKSPLAYILALFWALFSLYQLPLHKIRPKVFSDLRQKSWDVEDEEYIASFQPHEGERPENTLNPIGDMGFSGSTFYSTKDQRYLVKSVPRHSEHSFFRDDLLQPYAAHMASHPRSLLVRICDFLACPFLSIGRALGLAPSHHIVMDNIMYGKEQARQEGKPDWENWDLKPTSYFYPERDIADGRLTSDATKAQLADEFHDKIILSRDQADAFFASLEEDTRLLAHYNAVDYSLFLVRIKMKSVGESAQEVTDPSSSAAYAADVVPRQPPAIPPGPPSWRTGIPSPDGKHVFRAAVLDFFWAKHKVQPILMTLLINAWNLLISRKGPMSITTTPDEYRERFLKMCHEIVEVRE